jgi:hypothetical protein
MLDAAREALSFAEGRRRADLDQNRMLSLSLLRLLETIGEAAGRVTEEGRRRLTLPGGAGALALRDRRAGFPLAQDAGPRGRRTLALFQSDEIDARRQLPSARQAHDVRAWP